MKVRLPFGAPNTTSVRTGSSNWTRVYTGGEEEVELFPKDAYDVPGEVFTGLVGEVGEAVEPHGAGEEVGAREGDLDGPISALGGEFKLVEGERPASAEFAVNDWDGEPLRRARRGRAAPFRTCRGHRPLR